MGKEMQTEIGGVLCAGDTERLSFRKTGILFWPVE
jgi:hypothetical protein